MTGTLEGLLEWEGALGVLGVFGLGQVLTDRDDPHLWAAVLVRHWPAHGDPDAEPSTLRFGVGGVASAGDVTAPANRSGMVKIVSWCFERVDADHLRSAPCSDAPRMPLMSMIASGKLSELGEPGASLARDYLDISRPTLGEGAALVHAGMSAPPNMGLGETHRWVQGEDGHWVETDEVVSGWLT